MFDGSDELAGLYAELHLSCRRATDALHQRPNEAHCCTRRFPHPIHSYLKEEARASQLWARIRELRTRNGYGVDVG